MTFHEVFNNATNVICASNRPSRTGESSLIISGSNPAGRTGVILNLIQAPRVASAWTSVSGTWSTDSKPFFFFFQKALSSHRDLSQLTHNTNETTVSSSVFHKIITKKHFHYSICGFLYFLQTSIVNKGWISLTLVKLIFSSTTIRLIY